MARSVELDFTDEVVVVTGAAGTLGTAVVEQFTAAGATVCATDIVEENDVDALPKRAQFYQADFTDESSVVQAYETMKDDHGEFDALCSIAGMWQGGTPIQETSIDTFEQLFAVNLRTLFLAAKHAIPSLQRTNGSIVAVSARASLEGGEGDGPYRAAKAGVRRIIETIAEEQSGELRANAVMPSVIDTPANRNAMEDADYEKWVDPADIAETIAVLCSPATTVTSGAAIPVYGEA
ncbi:SDR family oxidoreductase [Halocatena halophila]|uniref:SDR family oxidoreductase n=1 Tax=Halocatena halophila TaxID=2814576 RepID=UPI002ED12E94